MKSFAWKFRSVSMFALIVAANLVVFAQDASEPVADDPQRVSASRIESFVKPFADAGHFSGIVLASKDGKVILERAYGLANAEFGVRNSLESRIGVASITKNMTLVILVRLVEEGVVALDDEVSKYLPSFPNGDLIDLEMLAGHRSGIPHRVMPEELEAIPHTTAEMVERISEAELAFKPGSDRLYSSAGYTLMARVLEIASGLTYPELLQGYVFDPAGMTDSVDFDGEAIMPNRAQDYFLTRHVHRSSSSRRLVQPKRRSARLHSRHPSTVSSFSDVLYELDLQLGALVAKLHDERLLDDTIIFFTFSSTRRTRQRSCTTSRLTSARNTTSSPIRSTAIW